jgi:hypothetical protein
MLSKVGIAMSYNSAFEHVTGPLCPVNQRNPKRETGIDFPVIDEVIPSYDGPRRKEPLQTISTDRGAQGERTETSTEVKKETHIKEPIQTIAPIPSDKTPPPTPPTPITPPKPSSGKR